MKTHATLSILVIGLFLSGAAIAQTPSGDPNNHHPEGDTAVPQPGMPDNMSDSAMPAQMSNMMKMMTPEMMQMMHQMMGRGGMQGMMQPGQMPMAGNMAGSPGMPMKPGHQSGSDKMDIMATLYGMAQGAPEETTPERVREWLGKRLSWHGNPRLKIGEITTMADGNITAEIVTIEGSVVQKLAFNRYPGFVRQLTQ